MHFDNLAFSVFANLILQNHDFTGLVYGEIRLGSDEHGEGLQLRARLQLAFARAVNADFAQVVSATFRRYRPQNVSQKFCAEFGRLRQILHVDFDVAHPCLGLYPRFATSPRQGAGAGEGYS